MPIVEFDGPPPWCLDAPETEEITVCPWVVAVGLIAIRFIVLAVSMMVPAVMMHQ